MYEFNKINLVESIDVEFKSNFEFENKTFIHKIYKTIRAFANTNGGKLIIGVNDDCEVIGIPQEEIDKIVRHLCDVFKNKVELITNPILHKNKKWYLEIYVSENKEFIYENKQMKEICIRENSSLKTLKGKDIIAFWDKKKYYNTKINNFFNECCNKNLSIDWKYKINEFPDLNLRMDRFCNFFKSIWLKSKIIYFLNPEKTSSYFQGTIRNSPYFDYNCKTIEFQIDFFSLCIHSENLSKYKILSSKLGSVIEYYSGSIIFKINKKFEITNYFYKFDDKLLEFNIQNIKMNLLRNINEINRNKLIEINKILEAKIVECNNNFRKYSIEDVVDEIKKYLK
ncbi:helix-turn-helix domain-containing protein [Mesomycoplasma moatsii]|uniref:AlbA family DNA-binding domain-containing protein n=1 Tax=Mesomycoplasma moatsii TaxID=171287 RepID=UPI0003B5FC38